MGHPQSCQADPLAASADEIASAIPTEGGPVPGYGVGLDDHEHVLPAGPEAPKCDPEEPILGHHQRSRVLPFQNGGLLSQSQDFQGEIRSGTDQGTFHTQE